MRGLLHIELYAWPLRILHLIGLDYGIIVRYSPYLLHIVYHLIGDYYFIRVGELFFGKKCLETAFVLRITNALYADFMCRPFSNSIEEIFFIIGLYYFKRIMDDKGNYGFKAIPREAWIFAFIVPLHFLTRNTSCVLWFVPLLWILIKRTILVPIFFITTVPLFALSVLNDYRFYGEIKIPFYEFMKFNHDQFWHEGAGFFFFIATPAFM